MLSRTQIVSPVTRTLDLRNGVDDSSFPLGRHVSGAEGEIRMNEYHTGSSMSDDS